MSFLTPFFMLGALAVAAPIIFHLIRRTSREKVPFGSLMFLLPTPPRVTRHSRLENIFLLILRCLVLCLLALGFARPFLQRPVAAGTQSGTGTRLVLLVDTSASMRRDNLWADARARAEEVLRKTVPGDAVTVLTFDARVHPLVNFEQWSVMAAGERAALTGKRLAEVSPSWSGTRLGSALLTAVETIEDSAGRGQPRQWLGPKRIVLITDLQEGSHLDGLQGYEWPRGIEVILEPLKAKRPTNAGLQLVTERDDTDKPATDAQPRVRVSNSTEAKREQFQVGWTRAGEKGFVGTPVEVYVPPGQSRIVSAPKLTNNLTADQLTLTGDDHDFDNTVHLAPPKPEQIKVLFLGREDERDPAQSLYYVKRAFQETRRASVQVVARTNDLPLSSEELAGAQLMIVTDTLSENGITAARAFLDAGKTILFVLKSPSSALPLARLLNLDTLAAEEADASGYAMLAQIDFQHSLFAPFADPRFSDFTKIHFWKHRRLGVEKIKDARVLAHFDKGDAAFLQAPAGQGTLLVLTSGWVPADSQFALSSKFVPLLYSILEQSGNLRPHLAQYLVGDDVPLAATNTAPALTVRKPDGSEVKLVDGKFTGTDLPGIYTVTPLQPPLRFAVNLDPAESKTAPLPPEDLERLGLPLKTPSLQKPKLTDQKREHLRAAELESRQKLWRWLLVCALVILLMETWLAGWLTHRTGAPVSDPAL